MIAIEQLSVRVGQFALDRISFAIPAGMHGILMGRTGCGKSTILEAICGLKPVRGGRVILEERDVTHLKPALRGIGYVPQDGALFPSMTVAEHLAFALEIRRWPRDSVRRRVAELGSLLGIEHLLHRRPFGLSGGEAQRVALGRALANRPSVLCLDEPLSALDEETREGMCAMLRSVRMHTGVTILHVTHSLTEARHLGDRVFGLREGQVTEVDLTNRPSPRRDGLDLGDFASNPGR